MATTEDTLRSLISARNALVAQTDKVSPTAGQYLWSTIDDINDEIDALTAQALTTAPYVPQTDPFKATTDSAKTFVAQLNDVKSVFSTVDSVVNAAATVIGIVLKL